MTPAWTTLRLADFDILTINGVDPAFSCRVHFVHILSGPSTSGPHVVRSVTFFPKRYVLHSSLPINSNFSTLPLLSWASYDSNSPGGSTVWPLAYLICVTCATLGFSGIMSCMMSLASASAPMGSRFSAAITDLGSFSEFLLTLAWMA